MDILDKLAVWSQVISLPIAVIAILVSIWLYWKGKQNRAIACYFEKIEFPIEIKSGDALDGAIEILYKGKSVKNVYLVRVRIKNTGTLPIRNSGIINPMTFIFEPNTIILREPRTIEQKPQNLKVRWEPKKAENSSKEISLLFDLLNPNDELSVEFMCSGEAKLPTVEARIEGVRKIDSFDPEERQLKKNIMDGLDIPVIFLTVLFFQFIQKYYPLSQVKIPQILGIGIIVLILVGGFGLFALLIWVKNLRPLIRYVQYKQRLKENKRSTGSQKK